MIIETFFEILLNFVESVFSHVNLPPAPDGLNDSVQSFFDLLENGLDLLHLVIPVNIGVYLSLALALFIFEEGLPPIKWIINKIIEIIP